jgi:hypothetical protein
MSFISIAIGFVFGAAFTLAVIIICALRSADKKVYGHVETVKRIESAMRDELDEALQDIEQQINDKRRE